MEEKKENADPVIGRNIFCIYLESAREDREEENFYSVRESFYTSFSMLSHPWVVAGLLTASENLWRTENKPVRGGVLGLKKSMKSMASSVT